MFGNLTKDIGIVSQTSSIENSMQYRLIGHVRKDLLFNDGAPDETKPLSEYVFFDLINRPLVLLCCLGRWY